MSLTSNRRNRKNEQADIFQEIPSDLKIDIKHKKKVTEELGPFEFNPPQQ